MWMVLIGCIFKVERAIVAIDDFEHSHIIWAFHNTGDLLLEAPLIVVLVDREFVSRALDHGFVRGFQRLLGQVTTLIIEEAVAVARPRNTLH